MAYACESEPIGESEPADLRAADGELFEPGMLESLTREQLTVIGMAVKNYDIKDIAKYRGTQPEQIDLVFENIRRQTQLSLRELAGLLIANGLIEPAPPRDEVIMPAEPSVQTVLAPESPAIEEVPVVEITEEASPEAAAAAKPEQEELPPAARQQIQAYLSWMYPRENFDELDKLSDEEMRVMADAVRAAAKKYDDSLRKPRKRHVTPAAVNYMDLWLQGHGIPKIADLVGKNEGTVRFSLAPFAEKIGKHVPLDDLLRQAAEAKES